MLQQSLKDLERSERSERKNFKTIDCLFNAQSKLTPGLKYLLTPGAWALFFVTRLKSNNFRAKTAILQLAKKISVFGCAKN